MSREKKFILEFIELYRGFPQIWKVKSVDYKDRTLRKYAFGELLKKLKEVEPDATVDSVRKKINCLRTAYRRELKKQKASEKSGADAADIYDPTLFYFSEMSFIRNQETPVSGRRSMNIPLVLVIFRTAFGCKLIGHFSQSPFVMLPVTISNPQ